MNVNRQKEWRTVQIAASEIAKYDKGSQIEDIVEKRSYDFLVTSPEKGLQYGVEIKRSEFSRTKAYTGYLKMLQQRQNEISVPILLVCINESSEEVKIGIVFSWFHKRPLLTRDIVLWKSTQENWNKALNLMSISAHVEGPIEFLQMDSLYVKKTIDLNIESLGGYIFQAELVYMRKLSPDYKMNPIERNTLEDEMQFYLRGYEAEEYPFDSLDTAILTAVRDKFADSTIQNQLVVLNTELRDLQIYREYDRGQVSIHVVPSLKLNGDIMLLLGQHTEFIVNVELYAHSIENRDYFNNMEFRHQDAAEGWVESVIEYEKCLNSYRRLSDIIG